MIPRFPKTPAKPRPLKAQSSNVVSFIHDPETNHLTVTFHGGRIYRYDHVSAETHDGLRKAESKGDFLNKHIAEHHTFKRIK